MDAKLLIKEIVDFRKNNKNCVSTSHTFTIEQYLLIAKDLQKKFNRYDAKVDKNGVQITIDRYHLK